MRDERNDIPRVIHYCWFGGKPLPREAEKCLDSWRRHMPGCELRRWDESNYRPDAVPFTAEAARQGLWAFVSDYARFDILFNHGGIYLDTDVELVASLDPLLKHGAYMGWERTSTSLGVNSGLGMAAPAGMEIFAEVLADYAERPFADAKGNRLAGTVVTVVTDLLLRHGLVLADTEQKVAGLTVYPSEYFNPLDDLTGRLNIGPQTYSIHHFAKTWLGQPAWRTRLSRAAHRWLGLDMTAKLKRLSKFKK